MPHRVLILLALVAAIPGCGRPAAQPRRDASPSSLVTTGSGLTLDGVGDLWPGAHPDPAVLEAAGPDPARRWVRQPVARGSRYQRAVPLGVGPGSPPLLLREQIWLEDGAVIHVGQGYTVVAGQCGAALRRAHHGLMAAVAAACGPGATLTRAEGTDERMVHYLCERPQGIARVDLRPDVPVFVDTRSTRAGVLSVSLFAAGAAGEWLDERFHERRPSDLAALRAEARPLVDHVAACDRGATP